MYHKEKKSQCIIIQVQVFPYLITLSIFLLYILCPGTRFDVSGPELVILLKP